MNTALWQGLKSRMGLVVRHPGRVGLHYLGLRGADLGAAQAVLDQVGAELAVNFALDTEAGEVVLLDAELAERMSPELIEAMKRDRPLIVLAGDADLAWHAGQDLQRFERQRQLLLHELAKLPLVRQRSARQRARDWAEFEGALGGLRVRPPQASHAGFDSAFDSRLDSSAPVDEAMGQAQRSMLCQVLDGWRDPATPSLSASYGPQANLRFDFAARRVVLDPLAVQGLRIRREMPQPAPGALPGPRSTERTLAHTLWDLGIAGGQLPLLGAPPDWWHVPLSVDPEVRVQSYTRVPQHMDIVRRLQAGPLTPSVLRRQARADVSELRRVLQACLVLQLAHWRSDSDLQGERR